MLRLRTKMLLLATGVFGIGIGLLSGFADGAYSAICLFVLPLFVALAALSIIADFNRPITAKTKAVSQKAPAVHALPLAPLVRAAYQSNRLREVSR